MGKKEIKFFDEKIIQKELDRLPAQETERLLRALDAYRNGYESGFRIKDYKLHGICMITDSGSGQGRALYIIEDGLGRSVVLKVYKKEAQKVDKTALETAIQRKRKYLSDKK